MTTVSKKESLLHLYSLYTIFEHSGDSERTEKVKELIMKVNEGEFSLAFCGHFSAGKSSIINYFAGTKILPSSPIPTSANIVKIKRGNGNAKITLSNGEYLVLPPPLDVDRMKRYSKDGNKVQRIEMGLEDFPFEENLAILDTPGVDSTDEAHELSTASSFHLADAVFYVTDYNHIQSEINFQFTRDLTKMGKKLYIIINQIDKHNEQELSFESFKESAKKAFREWEVPVEAFYFTTMKDLNHPLNDIEKAKKKIIELSKEALQADVRSFSKQLIEEHLKWKYGNEEEAFESVERIAGQIQDGPKLLDQLLGLNKQVKRMDDFIILLDDQAEEKIRDILDNGNLTPYEIREQARLYLESNTTSFKVGKWFGKSKTEAEKQKRRNAFLADLSKQTETSLLWHVKELFYQWIKESPLDQESAQQMVRDYSYQIAYEDLIKVEPVVTVSGNLVLNFMKACAESIRKSVFAQSHEIVEQLKNSLHLKRDEIRSALEHEAEADKELKIAWDAWQAEQAKRVHYERDIQLQLRKRNSSDPQQLAKLIESWLPKEQVTEVIMEEQQVHTEEQSSNEIKDDERDFHAPISMDLVELKRKLHESASILSDLPGLNQLAEDLIQRARMLDEKTFTVALFGAFSAGKSSFANAMLGEEILPVSPNPTTAVINRILPPDDMHAHGTAVIHAKSEEMLLDDLNEIWKEDGLKASDVTLAKGQAEAILNDPKQASGLKTSFLKAFTAGIDFFKPKLNRVFDVDLDAFQEYAADESKSCFIERIDLYYDCPLTREGIILVDTPGADSINARHTGTSFNYIKHSDAICFVTYYNHAFSRADRNFLDQLGRVKDAFSMDKMFFILNAADLAEDEEEKMAVVDYLSSQLAASGIRKPRIFPLSSRSMLQLRTGKVPTIADEYKTQFENFEKEFHAFIHEDLMRITTLSSIEELRKAYHLTERFLELSSEGADKKRERKEELTQSWAEIEEVLNHVTFSHENARIQQEVIELLHYSKQRIFLHFGDTFKEAFNPAIVTNNRETLRIATNRLLDQLRMEVESELQAMVLRLEVAAGRWMREAFIQIALETIRINKDWSFSEPNLQVGMEYEIRTPLSDIHADYFEKEWKLFKNAQAFFERNEKKKLQDAMQMKLEEAVAELYSVESENLKMHFQQYMEALGDQLTKRMKQEGFQIFKGMNKLLEEQSNPAVYESALKRLRNLEIQPTKESDLIETAKRG